MADDNSLSRRVQRYAKVGTTIGGFAARTVGGRLFGLPLDRAEPLLETVEQIRPMLHVDELPVDAADRGPVGGHLRDEAVEAGDRLGGGRVAPDEQRQDAARGECDDRETAHGRLARRRGRLRGRELRLHPLIALADRVRLEDMQNKQAGL